MNRIWNLGILATALAVGAIFLFLHDFEKPPNIKSESEWGEESSGEYHRFF